MILITGCNGFIGRDLVNQLLLLNIDFIGVDRSVTCVNNKFFCVNLLKKNVLSNFIKKNLKVIVHIAAVLPSHKIDAKTAKEKNEIIDKNVFDFCAQHKIRLIYISGASIYSLDENKFIKEESLFSSTGNPYILGKMNSEILLKKMGLESIILRVNAPYGPNQNTNTVLNIFINRALQNLPLELHNDGSRIQDFIFINDISNAILKAIDYDQTDDFIIASGKTISMINLAKKIIKLSASKSEIYFKKHDEKITYPFFDISKAKNELKWTPKVDIKMGLIKTIFSN
jgi:nucleoside-diphosphate-sugar epimerase